MISDFEYLYMIRQNCANSLETVLKKFERLLWKMAHELMRMQNPQGIAVMDLFQEGTIGLFDALHTFKEMKAVGFAYYVKLCVDSNMRTALRKCRGQSYRLLDNRLSLDMSISEDQSIYLHDVIESRDVRHDPAFMARYFEAKSIFSTVLNELSDFERKVFLLREEGYGYLEISRIMDCTTKMVDNTVQKVRRKLVRLN